MTTRYIVKLVPVLSSTLRYVLCVVDAPTEQDAIEDALDSMMTPDAFLVDKVEVLGPSFL